MGYNDRDYYREAAGQQFALSNISMVGRIIIVNVVIYLLDYIFRRVESDGTISFSLMYNWMSVSNTTLTHPFQWYQLIAAGFAHSHQLQHIFFNMLSLFMFGQRVEQRLGPWEFLRFYLAAIFLGNLVFAIRASFSDTPLFCLGASGGVSAVVVLCCWFYPRDIAYIYGVIAVPLWLLGILMIGIDMLGVFANSDHVAHDVHLVGAGFALLYGFLHWNFTWLSLPAAVRRWFEKIGVLAPNGRRGRPSLQIHRGEEDEEETPSYFKPSFSVHNSYEDEEEDDHEEKQRQLDSAKQAEYDRLLAKISVAGIDSLTNRERETLNEYSRKMQQKLR